MLKSLLPTLVLPVLLNSCLVQRTFTDDSGTVIYQEPEFHTPFESNKKKMREVNEREEELGWQ